MINLPKSTREIREFLTLLETQEFTTHAFLPDYQESLFRILSYLEAIETLDTQKDHYNGLMNEITYSNQGYTLNFLRSHLEKFKSSLDRFEKSLELKALVLEAKEYMKKLNNEEEYRNNVTDDELEHYMYNLHKLFRISATFFNSPDSFILNDLATHIQNGRSTKVYILDNLFFIESTVNDIYNSLLHKKDQRHILPSDITTIEEYLSEILTLDEADTLTSKEINQYIPSLIRMYKFLLNQNTIEEAFLLYQVTLTTLRQQKIVVRKFVKEHISNIRKVLEDHKQRIPKALATYGLNYQ